MAGTPEFEYFVQFPTPRGSSTGLQASVNAKDGPTLGLAPASRLEPIWPVGEAVAEQKEELVVILLGWAGAKDQYLSKYSDIYLNRGCVVVRYITPLQLLFTDIGHLGDMTHKLVNVLKDLQLDTHPIFFHVFSNGGGITYSSFLREMQIDEAALDIRGTIFDSAPAPRKISVLYGAMVQINGGSKFRHVIAAGMVLLFAFLVFWFHLKTAFNFCFFGDDLTVNSRDGSIRPPQGPAENWMARITHIKDQNFLFIYSDADDLIAADKVDEFADILAKRGNHIKYLKFSDSPHVRHYMVHPKEYVDSIVGFIRTIMAAGPKSTAVTATKAKEQQTEEETKVENQ